jgi:hypothetical protein
MSALLRGELLKLRTTRTFVALVGSALALSLLVAVLTASLGSDFSEHDLRNLFGGDASGLFILVLGAIAMTGEWRHRTITTAVLAAPDRARLLAAKTLSYSVAGVVLSLVVTLTIVLVGTLILSAGGESTLGPAALADVLWRNLVVAAVLGALGVCIGAAVRNQLVAVVGLIVMAVIVEPNLLSVVPEVGRFGPLAGAPNGIVGGFGVPEGDVLTPGVAVAVSIGWVALAFASAAALLRRRDLV